MDKINNNLVYPSILVYPSMLEIQLTNGCNLNCKFCNSKARNKQDTLDLSTLIKFIAQVSKHGLKAVTLEGGGEPSLYDNLAELVLYLRKLDIQCGIITNGTNKLSDVVCENLQYIRVSLDSYDTSSYLNIKGRDYFDNVIDNIKYYSHFQDLVLGVSYIVEDSSEQTIKNAHSIIPIIDDYVDYIQYKAEESKANLINIDNFKFNSEKIAVYTSNCIEDTKLGYVYDDYCKGCYTNQLTSTILANGDVLFCKRLNTRVILGNIYTTPAKFIYVNNEVKEKYTEEVSTANGFSKYCTNTCRMKKYNCYLRDFFKCDYRTKYFL